MKKGDAHPAGAAKKSLSDIFFERRFQLNTIILLKTPISLDTSGNIGTFLSNN